MQINLHQNVQYQLKNLYKNDIFLFPYSNVNIKNN